MVAVIFGGAGFMLLVSDTPEHRLDAGARRQVADGAGDDGGARARHQLREPRLRLVEEPTPDKLHDIVH